MARKPAVLVTGANGEIGHGLIHRLADLGTFDILALDVRPLETDLARRCAATVVGDVLDRHLLDRAMGEFEISVIFHLAAILSTRAEFVPETAHEVNVQGTLNLLHLAVEEARSIGRPVKFLFPSSIAVYGLGSLCAKRAAGRVAEDAGLAPITMYGCGKLYCEHLGRYYARHYRQLAAQSQPAGGDRTRASCERTRGSRSWPCPMRSGRCSTCSRRRPPRSPRPCTTSRRSARPPASSPTWCARPFPASRSRSRRTIGGKPSWIRGPRKSTTRG